MANPLPTAKIAVLRNVFILVLDVNLSETPVERKSLSYSVIRDWVKKEFDVTISNSSITMVKEKCVLRAFIHFDIVEIVEGPLK